MPDPRVASPDHALAAAVAAIARGATPEAELEAVLALAVGAVGAARGTVFVWDAGEGRLALAAATGYERDELEALARSVGDDTGHPIHRVAVEQRADPVAGTPLRISRGGIDEPIGVLTVDGPAWTAGAAEASTLATFGDLIAVALDRIRLAALVEERSEWQERLAHTDALTGLANARTVSRVLELEVVRSGRQGTELAVIVVDVDGLAGVNAGAGPAAGDAILREVAAVVAESVRLVDTVARWGGDEFLVVAPGTAGATVARRIVDAVATRVAPGPAGASVSAGIARFPTDGATADELVAAATAALAAAKVGGPGSIAQA